MRLPDRRGLWAAILLLTLLTAAPASARRKKATAGASSFDYYLLALSYAPDFCAEPGGNKDPRECGTGRRLGFIVHGLWPQAETGRGPERCETASPVAQSIVQAMLNYIPLPSLVQHEWTNHGTCSGLSAADYFAAVRKARDSVAIPADLAQPTQSLQLPPSEIESRFAAANRGFPRGAFRASCYGDGTLQEVRVCFAKDLTARPCGSGAGACASSPVKLLPVH